MDKILENHCFEVYESTETLTTDTTVVRRARMVPLSSDDKTLTLATVWGTKFIHKALTLAKGAEDWKFSCSKPMLLKDNDLVYTWEFSVVGNVEAALAALRTIDRAPLEKINIEVGKQFTPLGPPSSSTRKVAVRATQGATR